MMVLKEARRLVGKGVRAIPWLRRQIYTSCDYAVISPEEAVAIRAHGWHSQRTARRQQRAYDRLLAEMSSGNPREDLKVASTAVDALGLERVSLLEVGCGGGYYSRVFAEMPRARVDYTGIDFSSAMIAQARASYPYARFAVGDATALGFSDDAFDVVYNGVSLMHIPDYRRAIAESRRVAAYAVIFHSVPVLEKRPTTHISKYAYGGKVVEVIFNRAELLTDFENAGLELVQSWRGINYDVGHLLGESSCAETFLCRPTGATIL
jgi:ubiquinone/menaquinone biosynthesis C-methylase UbiE